MSEPVSGEAPLFVVGVGRSGTTLLRWMLEEHPRIAIPVESHWIVALARRRRRWSPKRQEEVLTEVLRNPRYRRWWMSEHELRAAVRDQPSSYSGLVAAVFSVYAKLRGKPRWGDKTPWYVRHVELLDELFPNAVFLHIIRDGREVAASLAEMGERRSIAAAANYWRVAVNDARTAGLRMGPERYCEIRLEDLIAQPDATLRRVCIALGETYTPQMLGYTRRASALEEYDPRTRWWYRHLARPPTPGLRDWRRGLSASECKRAEAICAPLLEELGYRH